MSYLNEMENVGIILYGKAVKNDFESIEAIKKAANFVDEWAVKNEERLAFVYCGTTINWPDDFEYTPSIIGLVLADGYEDEADDGSAVPSLFPRSALTPKKEIPEAFWTELKSLGVETESENNTYLAVAGWAWVDLKDGGKRVKQVSAEDDGFVAIDVETLKEGSGQLSLSVGYC